MDRKLKVLMLNGSPRENGNIALAFKEMEQVFEENNVGSGCTATFDELNKFFTLSNMPVASSQYWNNIYGWEPGEGSVDDEGRQVMRVLARNMVFFMRSIVLGKDQIGLPKTENWVWTNFTR